MKFLHMYFPKDIGISVFGDTYLTFWVLISLITSLELVSVKVKLASKPLLFIFSILRLFSKYMSASLSESFAA